MEKATFAAGCFWGPEEVFRALPGVEDTQVGYAGDAAEAGPAEVVEVSFDPENISYEDLLAVFWKAHDPTQLNRQGLDIGPEYRSVIFTHNDEQRQSAERSRADLAENGPQHKPLVTQIESAGNFRRADEVHQRYNEKRSAKQGSLG